MEQKHVYIYIYIYTAYNSISFFVMSSWKEITPQLTKKNNSHYLKIARVINSWKPNLDFSRLQI